jgi:hypothetical protein
MDLNVPMETIMAGTYYLGRKDPQSSPQRQQGRTLWRCGSPLLGLRAGLKIFRAGII